MTDKLKLSNNMKEVSMNPNPNLMQSLDLKELLQASLLGGKTVKHYCDQAVFGYYKANDKDPISQIILTAYKKGVDTNDPEEVADDINHAIAMLQRVVAKIEESKTL
jgi:hypothetical protein